MASRDFFGDSTSHDTRTKHISMLVKITWQGFHKNVDTSQYYNIFLPIPSLFHYYGKKEQEDIFLNTLLSLLIIHDFYLWILYIMPWKLMISNSGNP